MYERFDHTADLGLRIRAADLDTLFADAARGLFAVIVANPVAVQPRAEQRFFVRGNVPDELEYLLLDWLNELLFRFATEHLVFGEFACHVRAGGLEGVAWGEPIDARRHQLEHEVKAITYHGLTVARTDTGWLAEVIVDI